MKTQSVINKLVIFGAITFGVVGCNRNDDQTDDSSQAPSGAEAKLAVIDGVSIDQAQFDAYLEFKRIPVKNEKHREALLDQYIEREALANNILAAGLLDENLINAELNEFRKEMLISRYFERFLKEQVTDQAIGNYYIQHAENYQHRKVHVTHILIRTQRDMSETERKAKLTTAQEAYSKLSSGEDFAEVAKNYSEDTVSAKKGGDLGWLKEGAIDPLFSETVFSMEKDSVTEPFETSFGFHIVKLLDGPSVVKRPLEAVKGDIRYQLRNEAKKAELERLMNASKITRK